MARGKRYRAAREKVEAGKAYAVSEALELVKSISNVKFTESVDVAIRLGIDPRKSDQVVRGAIVMPNGTGKSVRVAVFAQGENADKAKEAGADIVGLPRKPERTSWASRTWLKPSRAAPSILMCASPRRMPCASSGVWARSSVLAA